MTEPNFQLTPNEVRGQQCGTSFRGFDRAEVESFRDRVAEELDRLVRERIQLDERTRNAQEQLRAFRERERAMNDALIAWGQDARARGPCPAIPELVAAQARLAPSATALVDAEGRSVRYGNGRRRQPGSSRRM
jgi:DivIVA domain-containing protein